MGASVNAYWPGITEDQLESQPGFYNDCKAWGDWMAEREGEPAVKRALRSLGAEALLSHTTQGMKDGEVYWVSPQQLATAASALIQAVKSGNSETKIILETYGRNANHLAPLDEEFTRDLDDVKAIAEWAEQEGADRMTLEVNW
jgi:hypothetical protein